MKRQLQVSSTTVNKSGLSFMQELIDQIRKKEKEAKALEPSEQQRIALLSAAQDYTNHFLNTQANDRTYFLDPPNEERFKIDGQVSSVDNLMKVYDQEVAHRGINAAGPGHLGYIPGGGVFASSVGDFLAAVTNEYAGINYGSPGAAMMENAVIDWMKTIFSFPESSVGTLTSGGSIANMIALTAARDAYQIKGKKIAKSVIYMSAQVHHCVNKALRIIGLEDVIIRSIDLDERHRMIVSELEEKILIDQQNGLNPYLVVGSIGTTDTGAVDPIDEICNIVEKHKLWFHVDAAYGGFFVLAESRKRFFKGVGRIDSICVDPHKSLFLPYGIGAVLMKNKRAAVQSHLYTANYMRDAYADLETLNSADISPELTRHFRGMRIWLPLKLYGVEPFAACLEEKILLLKYMLAELVKRGFQIGPEPDLTVSYFWYPTGDENENAFNEALLRRIHSDGRVFFSSTTLDDKFVIRIAILSFRTNLDTVDLALEMIDEILAEMLDV